MPESFQYEEREWEIRLGWKEWEEMELRGRDEYYPFKYGRIVVWINGDCVDDFPRIQRNKALKPIGLTKFGTMY